MVERLTSTEEELIVEIDELEKIFKKDEEDRENINSSGYTFFALLAIGAVFGFIGISYNNVMAELMGILFGGIAIFFLLTVGVLDFASDAKKDELKSKEEELLKKMETFGVVYDPKTKSITFTNPETNPGAEKSGTDILQQLTVPNEEEGFFD